MERNSKLKPKCNIDLKSINLRSVTPSHDVIDSGESDIKVDDGELRGEGKTSVDRWDTVGSERLNGKVDDKMAGSQIVPRVSNNDLESDDNNENDDDAIEEQEGETTAGGMILQERINI